VGAVSLEGFAARSGFALFGFLEPEVESTLNGVVGRERAIAEGAGVLDEERLQIVLRLGLETLLMFLFSRPVGVEYAWNEDVEFAELEITIAGNNQQVVSIQKFPMSAVQLVRSCAEVVAALGPYVADAAAPAGESPDVLALSDEELTTALLQNLGKVRVFKMMYPDEEA